MRRAVADARRLVRDVRLVERRRRRQRLRRETIPVPRRRNRRGLVRGIAGFARPAAVRREEPDREEERLRRGRMPANQLDGLPPVDVGLVVRGAGPVGHEPAVLVQPVVVEAVGGRVGRAVPLGPARRDLRRPRAAVAVQVLADVDGVVAGRTQPRRKRVRVRRRELVVAAGRRRVPHDRVVVAVLARDVGRPRRAAERERREVVREGRPARGEQRVHVGHDPHGLDRLVVGHQHDDVRPGLRLLDLRRGRGGKGRREREERQRRRKDLACLRLHRARSLPRQPGKYG